MPDELPSMQLLDIAESLDFDSNIEKILVVGLLFVLVMLLVVDSGDVLRGCLTGRHAPR